MPGAKRGYRSPQLHRGRISRNKALRMNLWRSADIGLADLREQRLIHVECWNTIGDIGAAARSSARKQVELADLAIARWGTSASTGLVWVVRATAPNRALVGRYPETFASRF